MAGVDLAIAVWQYNEDFSPFISLAKGVGGPSTMKQLAPVLARAVRPFRQESSVVTWVPPSPKGQRRRGFDQGRVLAMGVATNLGLPVAPALTRSGRAQFGRSRSIRLEGPRLRLRPDWTNQRAQVIVVDDVITTGTSLASAAQLLRERHGTLDVVGAALAVRL